MSLRRIKKEYAEIQKLPSEFCCASPISEEDLYHWRGHIMGAVDTPFEGGIFFMDINFPTDYPFKPFKMKCLTKIFHPNINSNGHISSTRGDHKFCVACGEGWHPGFTVLRSIFMC